MFAFQNEINDTNKANKGTKYEESLRRTIYLHLGIPSFWKNIYTSATCTLTTPKILQEQKFVIERIKTGSCNNTGIGRRYLRIIGIIFNDYKCLT